LKCDRPEVTTQVNIVAQHLREAEIAKKFLTKLSATQEQPPLNEQNLFPLSSQEFTQRLRTGWSYSSGRTSPERDRPNVRPAT
jgi:hypothetical protein